MLNGAEIQAALSDLVAFFSGDENVDSGLARAAAAELEQELRPAVGGIARPDKGAHEVYRNPKAQAGLELVGQIRAAIDSVDTHAGKQACDALRRLAAEQHWI
jgi:hypothetical protein